MYGHLYGLNYAIFRPSVPYGPFQNPRRRQGAVMVFLYKALRGEPVVIWGKGMFYVIIFTSMTSAGRFPWH